ncbi:peptidoglycan-binding protein [Streptomyces sp. NBC_00820]|uniref:L,D-transpeptidase family protein n=1 Tax=Streptomyces sp. NBC_00820 TaxID=2975842 RepID=UPI002ED5368F|nr:peptidoglycan-binding protein [Streptomyces sp. NBC_00820]
MNAKYRTSLRIAAGTAASAGLLAAIGVATPVGTAAARDAGTTAPARLAQPLGSVHAGAKAVGASHARRWPTLRSGSRGPAVRAVQHLLTARGNAAKADGVFGSRTKAAVKAFQNRHHLRADGAVGSGTWNALVVTVRSGSRGHAVIAAQQLLTARGHAAKADGVFGSRTTTAVKAFQNRHHLRADGVVGPDTWSALVSAPAGATPVPRGYVLKFSKNWDRTDDSRLALYRDGRLVKSYRAGSGMGSTDECAKKRGWLPSGTYKVLGHQTDRNSAIKGYAIHLADKACHPKRGQKPVRRGDLFIHSNMTPGGASRWRGNYKSYGCVKLAPADIKNLFAHLNQAHWPKNLTLQVG